MGRDAVLDGKGRGPRWRLAVRLVQVASREGARGLALKALARLCFRHVVLVERELRDLPLDQQSDVPIDVRPLAVADAAAYVRFRPNVPEPEVRRRLAAGHFCYATWADGRITSAVWGRTGHAWIPEVDAALPLAPGEVNVYDSWTTPEMRGHNIASARGARVLRLLKDQGHERVVGHLLPENRSGVRPGEKLGVRRCGVMAFLHLGVMRGHYLRRNGSRQIDTRGARASGLATPAQPPS